MPEWTPDEVEAAARYILHRREMLREGKPVTLDVRIKAGEHDQWFHVHKVHLDAGKN